MAAGNTSKTSYRSSLDKYGLAAAEKLSYLGKNVPEMCTVAEGYTTDSLTSCKSEKSELPSFPPSNRHSDKPVLRVPPSYRQKPSNNSNNNSKEIWVDMVPSKTTVMGMELLQGKSCEENNNLTHHSKQQQHKQQQQQQTHCRKKNDDPYFSDYEVERRKKSQRKKHSKRVEYDSDTQETSRYIPHSMSHQQQQHRSHNQLRGLSRLDEEVDYKYKTKSESNIVKSYRSKSDAVASLKHGIHVLSPSASPTKRQTTTTKSELTSSVTRPCQHGAVGQHGTSSRLFGMLSAEDQRRTRVNYVTQDDMSLPERSSRKSPTKMKQQGKKEKCRIS
jgi:hypothetical protein